MTPFVLRSVSLLLAISGLGIAIYSDKKGGKKKVIVGEKPAIPNPKPMVKPEEKPEIKPEEKPEIKPEEKPEIKPEEKPEEKGIFKPEEKPAE